MISLQVRYGGEVVGSIPIYITHHGWYVKALVKSKNLSDQNQTGHVWRNSRLGAIGHDVASVDSTVNQNLQVLVVADTDEELLAGEFIVLEHVILELIEQ